MSESFIHQQYFSDLSVCDALISEHKNSTFKHPGQIGNDVVAPNIKDSTDVMLGNGELSFRFFSQLQEVVNKYTEKFPWCNAYAPWGVYEGALIQHYLPNGGFKVFHAERSDASNPKCMRHLVFMTYLNDVTDEGGTEFVHQKLITQPRKGLTLIWPADWTHTHRGIVSPTQEKYIITGWFSFIPEQEKEMRMRAGVTVTPDLIAVE
jgi:hypothetical protein